MDQLSNAQSSTPTTNKRRKHSPAFRAKIVALTREPNASIASIAQRYNLNANLVHKWRKAESDRTSTNISNPAFLPIPVSTPGASTGATVQLRWRELTIDWPLAEIDRAIPWLKALGL